MNDDYLEVLEFVAAMRARGVARFTWGALSVEFDDRPVEAPRLVFSDQDKMYQELTEALDDAGQPASTGYSDEDLFGSSA